MGELTNLTKGGSDGASFQSKAAMKQAGVGPYGDPPVAVTPPPQPPPDSTSQVGSIELKNEDKLREMLIKRGSSPEEAARQVAAHKRQKGYK